eukprot:62949-Alexandrium_andersonii.AAC.1
MCIRDRSLSRARDRRKVGDPDVSALPTKGAALRAAPRAPRAAIEGFADFRRLPCAGPGRFAKRTCWGPPQFQPISCSER